MQPFRHNIIITSRWEENMLYVVCRNGYRMAAIELLTVVLLSLVTCRQCLKYEKFNTAHSIIACCQRQCIEVCSANQSAQSAEKKISPSSFSYQGGLSWHLCALGHQDNLCTLYIDLPRFSLVKLHR